jgi:hypothetical protein
MDFQQVAYGGRDHHEEMRRRWAGLFVAGLTGAVASVALIAIVPTWLSLTVAGTATLGWCVFLEYEERASNRQTLELVRERVTAGGTVYVLGKTYAGTRRAIDEASRCAGDRPLRMVVFVMHRTDPDEAAIGSTVTALRRDAEAIASETKVMACACRRPSDVAPWLTPMSAVVIERVGPFCWPTFGRRLAGLLRRAGCRVALA